MKKHIITLLTVCLALCVLVAALLWNQTSTVEPADIHWESLHTYGDVAEAHTKVTIQTIQEEPYLILPSTLSPEAVPLFFDVPDGYTVTACGDLKTERIQSGDPVDLTALCSEGADTLTLKAKKGRSASEYTLHLSFTDRIGSMYLISDDPENEGRLWVESSPDKSNKATGHMLLQHDDGSIVYHDALTQIKGRGNSTWKQEKKPYQIKLSEKTDLLQTPNEDNRSKTWVLLANLADVTSMRNTLIYDLGLELGMEFCPENQWVNLYYDGEYRGCYLLSEKVEIDSGRVDITDLEEQNEEANDGLDLEALPVETGKTANGATYWYCAGMNAPEDITGGYLLELEIESRVEAEISRFITSRGQNVVVKSPEYACKEEMDYIASLFQAWEDAVYNGGVNPETGKLHTDYLDLRSAAICYLANEFSKNQDGFHTSAYFYKDRNDERLYMGPLWDYDITLNYNGTSRPTGMDTASAGMGAALCEFGEFREMVKQVYLQELYPLLADVVLGEEAAVSDRGELRSIRYCDGLLSNSLACNALLWPNPDGLQAAVTQLRDFAAQRAEYLKDVFSGWSADTELVLPDIVFTDVDSQAWYCADVHKAAEYRLMSGGGADAFYPTQKATRGQVIQTIYNLAGKPVVAYSEVFTDVKQHAGYANAVCWGLQTGVLTESADGLFGPGEPAAREEVVLLLHRYAGSPEADSEQLTAFADAAQISDAAQNAMAWAVEAEILEIQDNLLRPKDTATRAELASMLVRVYELMNN